MVAKRIIRGHLSSYLCRNYLLLTLSILVLAFLLTSCESKANNLAKLQAEQKAKADSIAKLPLTLTQADEQEIHQVLNIWNDAHYKTDMSEFSKVYASLVTFEEGGVSYSNSAVIAKKRGNTLLKQGLQSQRMENVKLTPISQGEGVRVDFDLVEIYAQDQETTKTHIFLLNNASGWKIYKELAESL